MSTLSKQLEQINHELLLTLAHITGRASIAQAIGDSKLALEVCAELESALDSVNHKRRIACINFV